MSTAESEQSTGPSATLWQLFAVFAKIGVSSFGGGVSGWVMREVVIQRRWMNEDEFLTGLAMAQAMPGVNVVNLPLWIGYRMAGLWGALVSASGVIVPPAFVILAIAGVYDLISSHPSGQQAFIGIASAGVGLSGAMSLRAARRHVVKLVPAVLMGLTFVAIGILRWPLLAVFAVLGPIGIAYAWWEARR
jgi:chromate transporter